MSISLKTAMLQVQCHKYTASPVEGRAPLYLSDRLDSVVKIQLFTHRDLHNYFYCTDIKRLDHVVEIQLLEVSH